MLAIRMQRVGRKGHPEFRVVVQDARLTPTSGRIVARVGHMNPHTKAVTIDKEKVEYYLNNGAQPSPRVVRMLQSEKVKLPEWVEIPSTDKKHSIKSKEKLRRNRPEEPKEEVVSEVPAEEPAAAEETKAEPEAPAVEEEASEAPQEEVKEDAAPETKAKPESEPEKSEA